MPWHQTPSQKKRVVVFTTVTTSTYKDQLKAGFSKVCEIFKVCGIESLKYESFTHGSVIDWLFDMSVKRPRGRALANKSCHGFQTFRLTAEGNYYRIFRRTIGLIQIVKVCLYLICVTAFFLNQRLSHLDLFLFAKSCLKTLNWGYSNNVHI